MNQVQNEDNSLSLFSDTFFLSNFNYFWRAFESLKNTYLFFDYWCVFEIISVYMAMEIVYRLRIGKILACFTAPRFKLRIGEKVARTSKLRSINRRRRTAAYDDHILILNDYTFELNPVVIVGFFFLIFPNLWMKLVSKFNDVSDSLFP